MERRSIPPELIIVCAGIQASHPCLTAVDLADTPAGGDIIDRALRTRSAT
jgi:hypothetical protein